MTLASKSSNAVPPAVWSFDLSQPTARFKGRGEPEAVLVEQEFRKFAALSFLHPEGGLVPSRLIDEYWHLLVQDTPTYREFCAQIFGEFIDHIPDSTGCGMADQFATTVSHYQQMFGTPEPSIWGEPGESMEAPSGLRLVTERKT